MGVERRVECAGDVALGTGIVLGIEDGDKRLFVFGVPILDPLNELLFVIG